MCWPKFKKTAVVLGPPIFIWNLKNNLFSLRIRVISLWTEKKSKKLKTDNMTAFKKNVNILASDFDLIYVNKIVWIFRRQFLGSSTHCVQESIAFFFR